MTTTTTTQNSQKHSLPSSLRSIPSTRISSTPCFPPRRSSHTRDHPSPGPSHPPAAGNTPYPPSSRRFAVFRSRRTWFCPPSRHCSPSSPPSSPPSPATTPPPPPSSRPSSSSSPRKSRGPAVFPVFAPAAAAPSSSSAGTPGKPPRCCAPPAASRGRSRRWAGARRPAPRAEGRTRGPCRLPRCCCCCCWPAAASAAASGAACSGPPGGL
ncbi:hypothetical protein GGR56DRAFT_612715 [Xylariaceae sp. FL0804]|nr:hypothetical protein GGR56DRAFT_612715 [Xylariaceae sp. FL0804]